MHINNKDNKNQNLNTNQLIDGNNNNLVYNTIYHKSNKIDTNPHKITSIVYNSDLISSINKPNKLESVENSANGIIEGSIMKKNAEWSEFNNTNINVHKAVSSSSNINESNDMSIYQSKDHSSSPVLYQPTNMVKSPSTMVTTPTLSSQLTSTYLSPLFANNKNNKTLINKNNSCLHVPRLIKSPILHRVSSITLPSIDTNNDNSLNSSAK